MRLRILAHARPADVSPDQLAGATVIVIDVLRATTTMATALAHGAREIVACASIDEARQKADGLRRERGANAVLTGGERKGTRIEGFDLGNSPRDYTRERIGGKTIVFTTTNGTVALHHARKAGRVLIGALVNRAAVARHAANNARDGEIHMLCAGTGGMESEDDCLTAGAIVEAIASSFTAGAIELDERAKTYREAWRAKRGDVAPAFRACRAGRNLIDVGLLGDIDTCTAVDVLDVVGEMQSGIVLAVGRAATTIPS